MRFEEFSFGDLGDLLGGMFGGGASRQRRAAQPMRGDDLETHVRISFEDSLKGVQVRVPVESETACSVCHGTGAEPGTSPVVCPQCGGRGVVSDAQGLFAFSQPCPRCHGNGTIVEKPCRHCRGSRARASDEAVHREDPARARRRGRASGSRARARPGHNGGPPGDLFVVVDVEPSPLFERRGTDLVLDVPVTYAEAALGASVQIPTPDGAVSLKVPTGTESGKLLRVKGRGAPHLKGNGRGDLLARVKVTVPKKLTKAETRGARGVPEGVARENARGRALLPAATGRQLARSRDRARDRPRVHDLRRRRARRHASADAAHVRGEGARPSGADAGRDAALLGRDVERLRLIQRLTTELGLNLAGVEHVLRLQDELNRLALADGAARARAQGRDRGGAPLVQARGRRSTGRRSTGTEEMTWTSTS